MDSLPSKWADLGYAAEPPIGFLCALGSHWENTTPITGAGFCGTELRHIITGCQHER